MENHTQFSVRTMCVIVCM